MAPYRTSQAGDDPMEEVLALQSYSPSAGGVNDCPSARSIVVICPSTFSSGVVQPFGIE